MQKKVELMCSSHLLSKTGVCCEFFGLGLVGFFTLLCTDVFFDLVLSHVFLEMALLNFP